MSLSKFASERQIIEDLIVGHITQNDHLYLPKTIPLIGKRPRVHSPKTNTGRPEQDVGWSRNTRPNIQSWETLSFEVSASLGSFQQLLMVEEAACFLRESKRADDWPFAFSICFSKKFCRLVSFSFSLLFAPLVFVKMCANNKSITTSAYLHHLHIPNKSTERVWERDRGREKER